MLGYSASVCIVLKALNKRMSELLQMPQSQCQLGEISWVILPLQSHTTLSFMKSVQGGETAKTRLYGTVLPQHHL